MLNKPIKFDIKGKPHELMFDCDRICDWEEKTDRGVGELVAMLQAGRVSVVRDAIVAGCRLMKGDIPSSLDAAEASVVVNELGLPRTREWLADALGEFLAPDGDDDQVVALDAWIVQQPEPKPSRAEATRLLVAAALKAAASPPDQPEADQPSAG
jgi:hypothetical protein